MLQSSTGLEFKLLKEDNMKFRLVTILAIASIILLSSSMLVSASIFPQSNEVIDVETSNVEGGFNIFNWLRHTFNIQIFSVVGDSRQCDRTPSKTLTFSKNDYMTSPTATAVANVCPKYMALIDVFDGKWNAIGEWKSSSFAAICGDSDGCIVEIYCCPFKECTSNSECESFYGSGSECKTKSASDPGIVYQDGSTFNYCTEPGGVEITCWYQSSSTSCASRTYIGDTTCPATYNGKTLYSSKSVCEANIPSQPSCGDGSCNGAETCSSCPADCGTCGGNGGTTGTSDIHVYDNVIIGDWSLFDINENLVQVKIPLQNFGDKDGSINVEVALYSPAYAKEIAQLPGFSIFNFYSVSPIPNCKPKEQFTYSKRVTLAPGQKETVEFWVNPFNALVTYQTAGTHDLAGSPLVFVWGLYQECLGGYNNAAGNSIRGEVYDYLEYPIDCGLFKNDIYCDGDLIGSCKKNILTIDKTCSLESIIGVEAAEEFNTTIIVTNDDISSGNGGLEDFKKISLTRDQAEKATTTQLLASVCRLDSECVLLDDEGYNAECISIAQLREDGILTKSDTDSLFSSAKVSGGIFGAGVGLVACLGTSVITGPAAPIIATSCAVAGAILGGTVKQGLANIFKQDELLNSLEAKDENDVGICVAEESFDIGSFIKKIGKTISITGDETTDGFIILGGGIILLFIMLNVLGGKK